MTKLQQLIHSQIKLNHEVTNQKVKEVVTGLIENSIKPKRFNSKKELGSFLGAKTIPFTPTSLIEEMSTYVAILNTLNISIAIIYTLEAVSYYQALGYTNITFITTNIDEQIKIKAEEFGFEYLTLEEAMKKHLTFDFIIGNPPYQAENNTSTKLWPQFILKCNELVNNDGYIALITPSSWTQPITLKSSTTIKNVNNILFGNSLIYYRLNCSEYFSVGVQISAWIIKKDGNKQKQNFLIPNEKLKNIAEKIIGNYNPDRFKNADSTCWARKATKKEKTSDFDIPIQMKKGIVFSNVDDVTLRLTPKIIIPRELGYFPKLDEFGEFGFNWQARAQCFSTSVEAKNAFAFYNSPIVHWIMKNLSWIPQADFTLLEMIKLPDFTKSISDEIIFELFQLLPEEIKLIESSLKK